MLGVAALLGVATTTAAAPPLWSEASLPGGRAGLLPRIGLPADVPLALAIGEAIRVVHAPRDSAGDALRAAREYFAAPPDGVEAVPVPLSLESWRGLLGSDVTGETLLARLLLDRRAALLSYGLFQLDRDTATFIAADPDLLRRIYQRHSGTLAAFGGALRVRDGALVLPGGERAVRAWVSLLGRPLTELPAALLDLLDTGGGRLLMLADAAGDIEPARHGLLFGPGTSSAVAMGRLRAAYQVYTSVEPAWRPNELPFVRPGADATLLLASMRVGPDGQPRHSQAFWDAVFGGSDLPADSAGRWADIDAGPRAAPAWLLARVTRGPLPVRQEQLLTYEFAERLTDRLGGSPPADLIWLTRAYRQYPALLLSLERLDIVDRAVMMRLVTHAARVSAASADAAALETGLTLFQAPLVLLTRARQARAIDTERARTLAAALSAIDPGLPGYGRAVAGWIDTALLPALGHDAAMEGASAEGTVLEALAGLRAPAGPAQMVAWEDRHYRADAAAPELARLTEVRGLQGGNTLDTALDLGRAGAALEAAETPDQLQAVRERLTAIAQTLRPIEASERTTAPPPTDLRAGVDRALRDLDGPAPSDQRQRTARAAGLAPAEDAALADVLASVLYAVWLGDPGGQAFLAGNVARRHDYGVRLLTASERRSVPWQIPVETSGDGEPWHLRGALLGLDAGLARLALRRTRLDLPDRLPTINESDRRALLLSLALTDPHDFEQADAARLAAWQRRGRLAIGSPDRLDDAVAALALDGRREQALRWTAAHAPEALPTLLLRTEWVLLGRDQPGPVPAAWGMAETALNGCLCLAFPDPPRLHRYAFRAGSGLLAGRIADLKLRLLELLDELGLPAVLLHGVLAAAMQDYLDHVTPAHGDDWVTLALDAGRVSRERVEDYVSALTAQGPLVPAPAPATPGSPR